MGKRGVHKEDIKTPQKCNIADGRLSTNVIRPAVMSYY